MQKLGNGGQANSPIMKPSLNSLASGRSTDSGSIMVD